MNAKYRWYQLVAEFSDGSQVVLRETRTSYPLVQTKYRLAGINLYRDRVYDLKIIEVYHMPSMEKK